MIFIGCRLTRKIHLHSALAFSSPNQRQHYKYCQRYLANKSSPFVSCLHVKRI